MDRLLAAPESLIHSVLVALCDDHRIQARALKYLAELQDFAAAIEGVNEGDNDAAADAERPTTSRSRLLKRKATPQRTQLCIRCKRAFDPVDNSPMACSYHDGELEVDEDNDMWAGWHEDVHGPMASAENREDYPQGFVWCESPSSTHISRFLPSFNLQFCRSWYKRPDEGRLRKSKVQGLIFFLLSMLR